MCAGFLDSPASEDLKSKDQNFQKHEEIWYTKINVDEDQNQYVRYAAQISNNDLDFLATLEAENGLWTSDRVGHTEDLGFCQISPQYHAKITNDKRFFSDPYWQLDQCWQLYSGGTRFYGYDKRKSHYHKFIKWTF